MRRLVPLLLLFVPLLAWATTHGGDGKIKCPIDDVEVPTVEIMSTNNFGGMDRDLMRRAIGDQPFMLAVLTCPRCHYSGYERDFDVMKVQAPLRKAIEGGGLQVPALPQLGDARTEDAAPNPSKLPAWARLDLAAQVAVLRHDDEQTLGDAFLHTAWAIRLEENPFDLLHVKAPESAQKLAESLEKLGRADLDVAVARLILTKLDTLPAADRRASALTAGRLLRSHGEHPDLLAALPAILATLAPEERAPLEAHVKASIELERARQRQSVTHFLAALPKLKGEEHAAITYLIGETSRRLGDAGQARTQLGALLADATAPEGLKRLAKEQLALVAK